MSTRSDELEARTLEVDGRRACAMIGAVGCPWCSCTVGASGRARYQHALDEPAVVAGHSFGGGVAIRLSTTSPTGSSTWC